MTPDTDAELVAAARSGDKAALDELVAAYLPLVYNIVGRALARSSDVEDTVQDTMLHIVRGLPGLRDPAAFRSWVAAITMNQIRKTHRRRQSVSQPPEAFDGLTDPGSDFADLAVFELGLTGQRREVAQAAAWLDDDDRELLSLWWLQEAGQLSRAEVVAALGVNPHLVTVRIGRMRTQLDTARLIVRALSIVHPCPGLTVATTGWTGEPSPLWRKRIARHVRECGQCLDGADDLLPAERLLAGLALVPLPIGFAGLVSSHLLHAPQVPGLTVLSPASHRRIRRPGIHAGAGHGFPWTGAVTAFVGASVVVSGVVALAGAGTDHTTELSASHPSRSQAAPGVAGMSTSAAAPTPAMSPAGPGSPTQAPTTPPAALAAHTSPTLRTSSAAGSHTTPHTTSSPAPSSAAATTSTKPPSSPPPASSVPPLSGTMSAEDQVLALINKARADNGLPPLTRTAGLDRSSATHTRTMLAGCGLNHICPGEPEPGARESAAGVTWSLCGENIGYGGANKTPQSIADSALRNTNEMLAEKPPQDGHRQNILSPDFHHIGISVIQDDSGRVWMTQDFSD